MKDHTDAADCIALRTPRMNAAANRAEDKGEPWAYSLLHVLEEGKKIEVELTEARELCARLTKERDEARATAMGNNEMAERIAAERDEARDGCKRLTQSNESLQAQCDRVNAENRELRALLQREQQNAETLKAALEQKGQML